ncbi:MAG: translation initiation factor IF-2 [Thaumarchaeota archaeon]|nr:translation initiation factor IF-2 [Nitrososphaerota archaeon]
MNQRIRQPVVVVLGHVDSGKTSLLDKIRGTAVQSREVGGITQHIGASFFPIETLQTICGPLMKGLGGKVEIPGLMVIDTPGHEIFSNLRSRGGSAADIAVLVVDALKGFEVQTFESVEILKRRKVPFVVALNKIDMITGWRKSLTSFVTESIKKQDSTVVNTLDMRIYTALGDLSRLGFNSEAVYRVHDFTKEIAIVPVSARTGEGIPELLSVIIGLTQQFLKARLNVSDGPARGIVLEVGEETGLGHTANVILLDGVLKTGDWIAVGRRDGPVVTNVKAILLPKPLDEIRDPRDKFKSVRDIHAASGVKIAAPELEGVLAGSPVYGVGTEDVDEVKKKIQDEVAGVIINTSSMGVILKSDALGSLEALGDMLKRKEIPLRIADIGPVTRRDVVEAAVVASQNKYYGVVLAFNVKTLPDAEDEAQATQVKIFSEQIVYNLLENYVRWMDAEKEADTREEFSRLTPLCKFKVLKGMIFRRSNPAIFGAEIIVGKLRQKTHVFNVDGKRIGSIHGIQDKGKTLTEALAGSEVAISMTEPMIGRQVNEGEDLYTGPTDSEVKVLRAKYLDRLSHEEAALLEEFSEMKRKVSPLYGL